MSLEVYRWGWFGTAISRAIWGWVGSVTPVGGFTPRCAVSKKVLKAAPVIKKVVSVKEDRRMRTTRRAPITSHIHKTKNLATTVREPESESTLSRMRVDAQKRADAGSKTVKLRRRAKSGGAAKVVNKTKKP